MKPFLSPALSLSGHEAAADPGRLSCEPRHKGYETSLRIRKRIEEAFGWMKTVAGQRKTKLKGVVRVGWPLAFAAAAYNLIRLPKLIGEQAGVGGKSRSTRMTAPVLGELPGTESPKNHSRGQKNAESSAFFSSPLISRAYFNMAKPYGAVSVATRADFSRQRS